MAEAFRVLVIVFLAMHGIGHVIWFLAAWTPIRAGVRGGPWSLPGNVTIGSPMGKVMGLVSLATVLVFLAAALMLLADDPLWRSLTNIGIVLSFISVVPWMRQTSGTTSFFAILADIILLFLLALPLGVELTDG